MPINFYTVVNQLAENGWVLISDSYKNLDTELEMKCPNGHIIKDTFKHWRKHPYCEICIAGDPYQETNSLSLEKQEGINRILALDAATGITGYAIYDNEKLINYGIYNSKKDEDTEKRINDVKEWLLFMIDKWQPDFVGLENIQLQSFGQGQYQVELYRVLANLQGVLLNTLYNKNIDHDLVYPASWRNFCDVGDNKGRENKKKAAQEKVRQWYNVECTQDEADAICIGKYFVNKQKQTKSSWGEDL